MKNRTITNQTRKNYWDLENCRKNQKISVLKQKFLVEFVWFWRMTKMTIRKFLKKALQTTFNRVTTFFLIVAHWIENTRLLMISKRPTRCDFIKNCITWLTKTTESAIFELTDPTGILRNRPKFRTIGKSSILLTEKC